MPLLLGALCVLAIAYRYYSAFLAARVAVLDDARPMPAHRFNDGQNYHPTNKWVLFGHHFAAISGAGPLIGPVLAIQYGYMPGLLWLVIGVCLAGAALSGRRCRYERRVDIHIIHAGAAEPSPETGCLSTGEALIDLGRGFGQGIARVEELHPEGVENRRLNLVRQPQHLPIRRPFVACVNSFGRDVEIPILVVAGLKPEGDLNRFIFVKFADQFGARVDLFHHQRSLIHGSTPLVASVTATKSSRA
jgi:hypothetical protein